MRWGMGSRGWAASLCSNLALPKPSSNQPARTCSDAKTYSSGEMATFLLPITICKHSGGRVRVRGGGGRVRRRAKQPTRPNH